MSKRPTLEDLQKLPLVKVQDFTHFPRNRSIVVEPTQENSKNIPQELIKNIPMNDEKQIIYGICPSKSNCYRIIKHGEIASLAKTKALVEYEKNFYIQCRTRGAMIDTYFELYVDVFYPSERSDLDNAMKVICDCMQKAGVIKNDNKCTKIVAQKFKDKENPRIEFVINKI